MFIIKYDKLAAKCFKISYMITIKRAYQQLEAPKVSE